MSENQKSNEAEIIAVLSHVVLTSLTKKIVMTRKDPGYVIVLSDYRFVNAPYDKSIVVINAQGEKIPGSLETFIDTKATDPQCIGIVPVTKGALESLKKRGLEPILGGFPVGGYGSYQAEMYGLK